MVFLIKVVNNFSFCDLLCFIILFLAQVYSRLTEGSRNTKERGWETSREKNPERTRKGRQRVWRQGGVRDRSIQEKDAGNTGTRGEGEKGGGHGRYYTLSKYCTYTLQIPACTFKTNFKIQLFLIILNFFHYPIIIFLFFFYVHTVKINVT